MAERERWPDGQVQVVGDIVNVEVTIALAPGRRLGAEYRFSGKIELDQSRGGSNVPPSFPLPLIKPSRTR
jgi:hypothetical protein